MEIIKLNLIPSGVNPTCHAKQYDKGRIIRFELFNGLTPYTLQSGDTVTLNLRKPDNTIIESSVTATQGNKYVDLVTTEQMCAVAGYNLGTFKIVNGETDIGTLNFIMAVERDVLADGVPSQSVIEDLDALVQEAVEAELGDDYYTKTETDNHIAALIDDEATSNTKAWSAQKIRGIFDGLPISATQMVAASGNDLNDFNTPACFFAETGIAHAPTSNDNFIILNYFAKWQSATRYNLVQLATNATNNKTYLRTYVSSNNTWKNWLPLFYDDTTLVSDLLYNQDETDRIRQNTFSLYASNGVDGFLKANGAVQTNSGYFTTDYIRIYNGQSFEYKIGHGTTLPIICFFTSKKQSDIDTSKTVNGIDGYTSGTFTATTDGYIRITYSKSSTKTGSYVVFTDNIPDNVKQYVLPDVIKDLNILCLGDSIFGNDGEIVGFINELSGASAINGAFGGTQASIRTGASDNFKYFDGVNLVTALCTQTWTDQDAAAAALSSTYPWITNRLATLKAVDMSTVDIITMDWGTNDYTAGKTIEEITTAYSTIIDLLQAAYPSVRILIITPIWRYFGAKADNENGDNKVYNVSTLKEIAAAIDENAKNKRIEALQMYQKMPLSYNTADLYFDSGDSTHLNSTGNKVYTHILLGKLRSMY